MADLRRILAAACLLCCALGHGGGPGLSEPAGAADHSVPARRHQRHRRPRDRAASRRPARQASHRRQPRRRRRRGRHRIRRQRAEGRPYAADRFVGERGQPLALQLPYDPVKSFAPVAMLARGSERRRGPSRPAGEQIKELVALAKSKPGDLQYASAGVGTFLHLAASCSRSKLGVDILHVPFRGAGPALIDVVGGHTKVVFGSVTSSAAAHPRRQAPRARRRQRKRSAALPDVPTVAEAGVPGYEAVNWIGLVAPAGTPEPIVARLHKEISAILRIRPRCRSCSPREGADVVQMSYRGVRRLHGERDRKNGAAW